MEAATPGEPRALLPYLRCPSSGPSAQVHGRPADAMLRPSTQGASLLPRLLSLLPCLPICLQGSRRLFPGTAPPWGRHSHSI